MEIAKAFKFCLRCGSRSKATKHFLACPKCGLDFYWNAKPVNAVILYNDKDEFLFVKRGIEPRKGKWDFPGGFVEEHETFEEALHREVKEELGIEIGEMEYFGSYLDQYLFQNVNYTTLGTVYIAMFPAGAQPKPADDVASFKFLKLKDFPKKEDVAFDSIFKMTEDLKKRFA